MFSRLHFHGFCQALHRTLLFFKTDGRHGVQGPELLQLSQGLGGSHIGPVGGKTDDDGFLLQAHREFCVPRDQQIFYDLFLIKLCREFRVRDDRPAVLLQSFCFFGTALSLVFALPFGLLGGFYHLRRLSVRRIEEPARILVLLSPPQADLQQRDPAAVMINLKLFGIFHLCLRLVSESDDLRRLLIQRLPGKPVRISRLPAFFCRRQININGIYDLMGG